MTPIASAVTGIYQGVMILREKRFPKTCVLPLKTYTFEGLNVQGPSDLETYLKVEYGYLGRDAMFDFASQLYVKIPESVYEELPTNVKKIMPKCSE